MSQWTSDTATTFRAPGLSARAYQVVVRADGYESSSRLVSFADVVRFLDDPIGIPLTPARGHLRVESEPPGARILLDYDSSSVWGTAPATLELEAGIHHVTSAPPTTAWRDVTVREGDTAVVTLTGTAREERAVHRVRIESIPTGAEVWVDDEPAPRGDTDLWLELAEGRHRLRLIHPSRRDTTDVLSVGPRSGHVKLYLLSPSSDENDDE